MLRTLLHRARYHLAEMRAGVRTQGRLLPVPPKTIWLMILAFLAVQAIVVVNGLEHYEAAIAGRGTETPGETIYMIVGMMVLSSLAWPTAVLAVVQHRSLWGWYIGSLLVGASIVLWFMPTGQLQDGSLRNDFDRTLDRLSFDSPKRRAGLNQMLASVVLGGISGGLIGSVRSALRAPREKAHR